MAARSKVWTATRALGARLLALGRPPRGHETSARASRRLVQVLGLISLFRSLSLSLSLFFSLSLSLFCMYVHLFIFLFIHSFIIFGPYPPPRVFFPSKFVDVSSFVAPAFPALCAPGEPWASRPRPRPRPRLCAFQFHGLEQGARPGLRPSGGTENTALLPWEIGKPGFLRCCDMECAHPLAVRRAPGPKGPAFARGSGGPGLPRPPGPAAPHREASAVRENGQRGPAFCGKSPAPHLWFLFYVILFTPASPKKQERENTRKNTYTGTLKK